MTEAYLTYGHRLERHIADTARIVVGRAGRRQARPLRGRAGRAAGHRPRHLSVRHVLQPDRGRGLRRRGRRAEGHRRGLGHREGLRDARRRRARSRPSSTTRSARRSAAAAASSARRPGRAAAHRLARHRRAALRLAHQRPDVAGDHEARRPVGLREDQGLHALQRPGRRRASPTSPTTSRSCTTPRGEYIELDGWTEDITECRSAADLPQAARDYLDFIAEQINVPIVLVGVGPGREQIIWMQGDRRSGAAPARRAPSAPACVRPSARAGPRRARRARSAPGRP